jgi:ribosomal protein L16 Arg81 hydroxylase
MHYEREIMPLMKCTLSAGDWLYIPGGWWHKANAMGAEPAISLALGVMPRTGVDVFDLLRREVLDSLLWRQRLPLMSEESSKQTLQELLEQLAADASRLISTDSFRQRLLEFLQTRE